MDAEEEERMGEPAAKKPKKEKEEKKPAAEVASTFYAPKPVPVPVPGLHMGTFPPPAGSPVVKPQKGSAVYSSAFMPSPLK